MAKLTVDGREFEMNDLNKEAMQHLAAIKACDQKTEALRSELVIVQTARESFYDRLNQQLPKSS